MSIFIASFAAYFLWIFLKAFQQLNVMHGKYYWVPPISLCMAVCEVYVISQIAIIGVQGWLILAVGLGGGLGAITSMKTQELLRKRYG